MKRHIFLISFSLIAFFAAVSFAFAGANQPPQRPPVGGRPGLGAQRPPVFPGQGISIGIEYCLLDKPQIISNHSLAFGEMQISGAKPYAESVDWHNMQSGPNAPINFSKLDGFVREYQKNGFTVLTIALKPHSNWGSVDVGTVLKKNLGGENASPKPQHMDAFGNWIYEVVERYDGDGIKDMPGLRFPVYHYEIGSEFSSYQPEAPEIYLKTLSVAYQAAHRAFPGVKVAHAAFLPTPADLSKANSPADYDRIFATTKFKDEHHGLADMRKILDHPELFDSINIHPLGDPYEIEHVVKWLNYETSRRGYHKEIIISDTVNTMYIGWGPATTCNGPERALGALVPPATEAERCRLADYFSKLVNNDRATLEWTRAFVVADHVQRTVIAAEQGIVLINLSFTTDLPFLTGKLMKAGAGISAWGGMIRQNHMGQVLERYPNFYSIQQMGRNLLGYDSIERVPLNDERARVYVVHRRGKKFWIGWMNPMGVYLPEDSYKQVPVQLYTGGNAVTVEPVITGMGQRIAQRQQVPTPGGQAQLNLSFTPIYIFSDN